MVILDSPEDMPQNPTLNKSSWKVIKSWVKQKSFHYEEEDDELPPGILINAQYEIFGLN